MSVKLISVSAPVLMVMAIILGYVDDDGHVSFWKRNVFSVPLQPKNHNVSLILDDHIMMNIDQSIIVEKN